MKDDDGNNIFKDILKHFLDTISQIMNKQISSVPTIRSIQNFDQDLFQHKFDSLSFQYQRIINEMIIFMFIFIFPSKYYTLSANQKIYESICINTYFLENFYPPFSFTLGFSYDQGNHKNKLQSFLMLTAKENRNLSFRLAPDYCKPNSFCDNIIKIGGPSMFAVRILSWYLTFFQNLNKLYSLSIHK
ncbi:hypothetical protein TRFO_21663 [Tritrichomonas foetus]|uniref:Uncharacterized protein n=1 Tax=Tritrichomonas foetus TaxID=1144522 RepID=A0A1J4KDB3_9EUKA|nr:hypothetical protein TRFO_21663 [Tritrichomonas foetus]|eukprot:OHT09431.1 hypothetical protein TRFO_21663 [Tritrichomonas foetus]